MTDEIVSTHEDVSVVMKSFEKKKSEQIPSVKPRKDLMETIEQKLEALERNLFKITSWIIQIQEHLEFLVRSQECNRLQKIAIAEEMLRDYKKIRSQIEAEMKCAIDDIKFLEAESDSSDDHDDMNTLMTQVNPFALTSKTSEMDDNVKLANIPRFDQSILKTRSDEEKKRPIARIEPKRVVTIDPGCSVRNAPDPNLLYTIVDRIGLVELDPTRVRIESDLIRESNNSDAATYDYKEPPVAGQPFSVLFKPPMSQQSRNISANNQPEPLNTHPTETSSVSNQQMNSASIAYQSNAGAQHMMRNNMNPMMNQFTTSMFNNAPQVNPMMMQGLQHAQYNAQSMPRFQSSLVMNENGLYVIRDSTNSTAPSYAPSAYMNPYMTAQQAHANRMPFNVTNPRSFQPPNAPNGDWFRNNVSRDIRKFGAD